MDKRISEILEGDRIFQLFEMELTESSKGYAVVRASVKEALLNAHNIAHGVLIFALLDVAFAIAANSVNDALGIQWSFNVFRPASEGDRVRGEARLVHEGKHSLVAELKVVSEKTNRILAQGMATALPFPRK
jgi:acyl-CoA thioesterase